MQVPHIRDGVYDPSRSQDVRTLRKESWRDDTRLVLACLEVRVRKQEEESGQGVLGEVVPMFSTVDISGLRTYGSYIRFAHYARSICMVQSIIARCFTIFCCSSSPSRMFPDLHCSEYDTSFIAWRFRTCVVCTYPSQMKLDLGLDS